MSNIKDRAVLVRFTDRVWLGGMIDRKVGEEVMVAKKAKTSVGHFWKRLIPKAALAPRNNAGSAARGFHMANTLPWLEGGVRILPIANYNDYMAGMRKLITKAQGAEKDLFDNYPVWIDEAKRTHGKLFDRTHFPTPEELQSKFAIEIDVIPLPSVTDWRVDLSEEQEKELRKKAAEKVASLQREGIVELYERLAALLQHAKEKLDDPKAIFRDSLVNNIKDFAKLLGKLNVTGDKQLESVRKELDEKLGEVTPEGLRLDPIRRGKVAKDAGEIMKKMSAYMGTAK